MKAKNENAAPSAGGVEVSDGSLLDGRSERGPGLQPVTAGMSDSSGDFRNLL